MLSDTCFIERDAMHDLADNTGTKTSHSLAWLTVMQGVDYLLNPHSFSLCFSPRLDGFFPMLISTLQ